MLFPPQQKEEVKIF